MATLPTRSFNTIVSSIAAGMQGRVNAFLNFALGSVLRAIAEAYAGVCLWLQGMVLEVAKLTRLSTSYGTDADSWVADWDIIERLGAQPATGLCTFSRFTPAASAATIAVGTLAKTSDGSQLFAVYADPTNPSYDPTSNSYVIAPSTQIAQVPMQAVVPGSAGNVAAGAISLITSAPSVTAPVGVDTVTNPAPFTNGIDSESDPAFKARFRLAIAALAKGTDAAIQNAIAALQVGLQATVQNSVDYDGTVDNGMVTVVVDDGSGNLPSEMLVLCQDAVNAVRAAGVRIGVYAAVVTFADVALTIIGKPGYYLHTVQAQVAAHLALKINALGLGNGLDYFTLAAWAKEVRGVEKIESLLLNNGVTDIPGSPIATIKARSILPN